MSALTMKLSELKSLVLSSHANEDVIDFFSGTEWFNLSREFLSGETTQKESIISVLDELTSNPKGAELSGIEVFIPTLWDSLVIRRECLDVQGKIFRILARITLTNSCVDYGNSLPKVMLQSAEYLCTDSIDVGANLFFFDALITHTNRNHIDIRHTIWSLLDFCADKCTNPNESIWKFLLLSAKLLPVLPAQSHGYPLPKCLQRLASFALKCLQTSNLMSNPTCSYSVFDFLLAITRFHDSSLDWLRPICLSSTNRGEPFAVLLTSVIVELRLRLPESDPSTGCIESCENPTRQTNWLATIIPDSSMLNDILVDRAIKLLISVLSEMNQASSEDYRIDDENPLLAEYLEDEVIEKFWSQLCDLGRLMSLNLSTKGTELTNTLLSDSTPPNGAKPKSHLSEPTILLLSAYMKWLLMYYETNRSGILSEHSAEDQPSHISQLRTRLVDEALTPVLSVLWPVLCSYFAQSSSCSLTDQLKEVVLSLSILLQSFPDLPIFSSHYSWKSKSFVQLLFRWIVSNWNSYCDRHKQTELTLLRGALIIANSVLQHLHHANQNFCDNFSDLDELHTCEDFLLNVCKELETPKHKFTAILIPVYTEVVILVLRILVQKHGTDSSVIDEIVTLARVCLFMLDDDSSTAIPFSLQLRLSEAIDMAISENPVDNRP